LENKESKGSGIKTVAVIPLWFSIPFFVKREKVLVAKKGDGLFLRKFDGKGVLYPIKECPSKLDAGYKLVVFFIAFVMFFFTVYSIFSGKSLFALLGLTMAIGYYLLVRGSFYGLVFFLYPVFAPIYGFLFNDTYGVLTGIFLGLSVSFFISLSEVYRRKCYQLVAERFTWPVWFQVKADRK